MTSVVIFKPIFTAICLSISFNPSFVCIISKVVTDQYCWASIVSYSFWFQMPEMNYMVINWRFLMSSYFFISFFCFSTSRITEACMYRKIISVKIDQLTSIVVFVICVFVKNDFNILKYSFYYYWSKEFLCTFCIFSSFLLKF